MRYTSPPWDPRRFCRPPKFAIEVQRYDGVRWAPDNGLPGLAFVYKDNGFPTAGWVRLEDEPSWDLDNLLGYPMTQGANTYGACNGQRLSAVRASCADGSGAAPAAAARLLGQEPAPAA